ncbi:MAG: ATP-binding protein [Bacteroidia bacterium]
MEHFHKAARNSCKIKMTLQGSSGSGKTFSALLLAYGITGDWNKIAVIDTENGSSHLYSHLGEYSVLNLTAPYSPEHYVEAIDLAVKNGYKCLIIDTLSAEWSGDGGILDIHSKIPGNSFAAWSKVTPRHNSFIQAILKSDIHVIATMRAKTEYIILDKNGKMVPEKVGLKAVQREDTEYEFTIVLELNQKHITSVIKDRTEVFYNMSEIVLNENLGREICEWCNASNSPVNPSLNGSSKHQH